MSSEKSFETMRNINPVLNGVAILAIGGLAGWALLNTTGLLSKTATLESNDRYQTEKIAEYREEIQGDIQDLQESHGRILRDHGESIETIKQGNQILLAQIAQQNQTLALLEQKLPEDATMRLALLENRVGDVNLVSEEDMDREMTERVNYQDLLNRKANIAQSSIDKVEARVKSLEEISEDVQKKLSRIP